MDTLDDTTQSAPAGATSWMQLPLRAFLTGPDLPVTVTLSATGVDAVLLGPAGTDMVEALRDGRIVRYADTTLAVPVTDPARQVELLRAALVADVAARRSLAETVEQRGTELNQLRASNDQRLAEIRGYAIDQYRQTDLSRDVLDAFLANFDFDPYQPRVKVTYTITGSFQVDSDNTDEVQTNVEDYLRPDLDEVDDTVEDSDEYSITVRSVEPADD